MSLRIVREIKKKESSARVRITDENGQVYMGRILDSLPKDGLTIINAQVGLVRVALWLHENFTGEPGLKAIAQEYPSVLRYLLTKKWHVTKVPGGFEWRQHREIPA